MANKFHGAISLTGGTDGDLDAIKIANLSDNDGAFVVDLTSNKLYVYRAESSSSATADLVNYTVIKPADEPSTPGFRWLLTTTVNYDGTNVIDWDDIARRVATPDTANLCGMDSDGDPTDSNLVVAQTPQVDTAKQWTETHYYARSSITSTTNSVAWDMESKPIAYHTLTENTTIAAPSNAVAGGNYILSVIQAAGLYTLAWNAVFDWGAATTPAEPAASGDTVLFMFHSPDGTNFYSSEFCRVEA